MIMHFHYQLKLYLKFFEYLKKIFMKLWIGVMILSFLYLEGMLILNYENKH